MPLKLLLVEDTESDRQVMLAAVREVGNIDVIVKSDGLQALEYLRDVYASERGEAPAAIFLDLLLPGSSGFDVLSDIHEHAQLRKVPIVVFTKSHRETDIYLSYRLGANAYVVKPVEAEQLHHVARVAASFWLHTNVRPRRR